MRPVKIRGETGEWAKPVNWNESEMGPCGALSVRREVIGVCSKAYLTYFSNWKPSAEELALLNEGGVVELECVSLQPAVSVGVVPCADPAHPGVPIQETASFWKCVAHRIATIHSMPRAVFEQVLITAEQAEREGKPL